MRRRPFFSRIMGDAMTIVREVTIAAAAVRVPPSLKDAKTQYIVRTL